MEEFNEIIDADSEELKQDMIEKYQDLSGRSLSESSPETLIFSTVAYVLGLREEKYNDDLKQNYVRYARDERLDLKGEIYGERGARLKEQPAKATFRFYVSTTLSYNTIIPKGTRIRYNDLYFETEEQNIIISGELSVDGIAVCKVPGLKGNDIPKGQIKDLVDIYPNYERVENITVSNGGTDVESDESYRERIRELPKSFTTAGSVEAYSFWTKTVSPKIIDCKIHSPSPTNVDIYIWTDNGIITEELKNNVLSKVSAENVRPLTDRVTVKEPEKISYNIDFDYYISKSDEMVATTIKLNILKAVEEYILWQKDKIGKDINPDELIKRVKMAGAKRLTLRSPQYTRLEYNQVADLGTQNINYQGAEEL